MMQSTSYIGTIYHRKMTNFMPLMHCTSFIMFVTIQWLQHVHIILRLGLKYFSIESVFYSGLLRLLEPQQKPREKSIVLLVKVYCLSNFHLLRTVLYKTPSYIFCESLLTILYQLEGACGRK